MKRVFLDTNILMDAAECRRFSPEALTILDLCNAGIIHVCFYHIVCHHVLPLATFIKNKNIWGKIWWIERKCLLLPTN